MLNCEEDIEIENSSEFIEYLKNNYKNLNPVHKENILNKWKKMTIHIGVIGMRGAGKSTLINTIRGLYPNDLGAAKVDLKECTKEPTAYPHPENPNIILWDLPGVSPSFPIERYLEDIRVQITPLGSTSNNHVILKDPIAYDCYVICCTNVFQETDLKLAKKIADLGFNYIFVRTKMDLAVEEYETVNDKLDTQENEEELIDYVKKDIKNQLAAHVLPSINFFAISALMSRIKKVDNRNKFEFPQFQSTIINHLNLSKEKVNSLVYTFIQLGKDDIYLKCSKLNQRIWFLSLGSGISGLSPMPGTSLALDMTILISEVYFYIKTLRLSENSLKEITNLFGIEYDDLYENVIKNKSLVNSLVKINFENGVGIINIGVRALSPMVSNAIGSAITKFLQRYLAANTVEELVKVAFPGIGSIIGAGVSFGSTFISLKKILEHFESTSLEIFEYCQKNRRR